MTGKKFANVFVFFILLAIVAAAHPLVVLADPGPAVVLQTDWGEVEIFLNTPDQFETAFFDAGDFTNLTNQTKLDMAVVGGLKQALKGNDADVLISPDKRHATLTNGQQVYWGMWLKDGSIGKVDAVTIVMRTTPKWGYPDIIRNGFSIAYTEPIGTGVGVGNTDIRTDSTFGKAFQVFNLPASRVTYFSFKARVCSGGVLTEFSPHFFKGPTITDVTPDNITCCCHETHELLLPVPKCWFSTWQYRWCNQNDMARLSYFLKCFRQKLYCRTLAVTDKIAKAQCADQTSVEITIKGDHLPRITLAEARENVHITPVDNPAITDEVRIEEVISSTHDALTLRVKILKCNPGKKQVTINGVGGMATTTFNKVITVAPDVLTREMVFDAVRTVGSPEQLPVTMNLDGDVMSFAPAVWQTISPTPSTEVSPTAMTSTSTGSNGNVVIGTAQAGDKAQNTTTWSFIDKMMACTVPQRVWLIDLVGMPLKEEATKDLEKNIDDATNRRDLSAKDEDDNFADNAHDGDDDGGSKPSAQEPGLYVGLNADDDNRNGIQDKEESPVNDAGFLGKIFQEDDLQRAEIRVRNAPEGAGLFLHVNRAKPLYYGPGDRGRIKIWKDRVKGAMALIMDGSGGDVRGTPLPIAAGDNNIPLWIEGVQLSNMPRDVVLTVGKVENANTPGEIRNAVDTMDITVIGPMTQWARNENNPSGSPANFGGIIHADEELITTPGAIKNREGRLHVYTYSPEFSRVQAVQDERMDINVYSYNREGKYWQGGNAGGYTGIVEGSTGSSLRETLPWRLPTAVDQEFLTNKGGGFFIVSDQRLFLDPFSPDSPDAIVGEGGGRVIARMFSFLQPRAGIRPPGWMIRLAVADINEIASRPNNPLALNDTYIAQNDVVEVLQDWKNRYKGDIDPAVVGTTYRWEQRPHAGGAWKTIGITETLEYTENSAGDFDVRLVAMIEGTECYSAVRYVKVITVSADTFSLAQGGEYKVIQNQMVTPPYGILMNGMIRKTDGPEVNKIKWGFIQGISSPQDYRVINYPLNKMSWNWLHAIDGSMARFPWNYALYAVASLAMVNDAPLGHYLYGLSNANVLGMAGQENDTPGGVTTLILGPIGFKDNAGNITATGNYIADSNTWKFMATFRVWIVVFNSETNQYIPIQQQDWSLNLDASTGNSWKCTPIGNPVVAISKPTDNSSSSDSLKRAVTENADTIFYPNVP